MTRMLLDLPLNTENYYSAASASASDADGKEERDEAAEASIARQNAMIRQKEVILLQRHKLVSFKIKQVERYKEETLQQTKEDIPVVSLRRKTTFFGLLLVVCQLAYVDVHNLLPAGIILYAVGIGLVVELLETPYDETHILVQWEQEARQKQRLEQRRRKAKKEDEEEEERAVFRKEELQLVEEMVNFEFHVLQGKPKVRVIAREEDNGELVYYTL
jgi:hypothetical protein